MDLVSIWTKWFEEVVNFVKKNKAKTGIYTFLTYAVLRPLVIKIYRRWKCYPPGPIGTPLIGNYEQFRSNTFNPDSRAYFWFEYAPSFGPIAYIPGMYTPGVILNDSSVIEQVLNNPRLNQRIPSRWSLLATPSEVNPLGILHGKQWAKRRQLALKTFINVTSSYLDHVLNESVCNTLLPTLSQLAEKQQVWFPKKILAYIAFNSVYHSNFGQSISIDHPNMPLILNNTKVCSVQ